jgi:hypothetical protein
MGLGIFLYGIFLSPVAFTASTRRSPLFDCSWTKMRPHPPATGRPNVDIPGWASLGRLTTRAFSAKSRRDGQYYREAWNPTVCRCSGGTSQASAAAKPGWGAPALVAAKGVNVHSAKSTLYARAACQIQSCPLLSRTSASISCNESQIPDSS